LQLHKSTLEDHGYFVMTATDGATAIATLENEAIAAVVLQYKSEGIDAEAVAWLIKRRFPYKPVVLLLTYSEVPERVLWLVDEYVMRSEPVDGLLRVIKRVTTSALAKAARAA
jgi:DNA-binding response OmpR family regulator